MAVTLLLEQLTVPPGQKLLIHNLGWTEFESLLEELIDLSLELISPNVKLFCFKTFLRYI